MVVIYIHHIILESTHALIIDTFTTKRATDIIHQHLHLRILNQFHTTRTELWYIMISSTNSTSFAE
ncbi:hypothetical protein GLOIN_2v1668662 [Rhizophagus irregularis DAOM 181602=DAOM 197198]|uniref:Uncharacterized protein n=1 Tax=Rhizophagus irregularis (strain DAOM 181602 / DAOM 197198 / MUCL 43194) TaxID=747089 RepID=A0A2P4PIL1_RHIID|nr:hypothetical protein GLOIN_2v1668662 [Rhizophagus irregularis DAOM 181602=DAOM 197198]POG65231.1 hypothetical protein GLOIN_2v1668662 [Rhizophagus irregularis DAOM 181602=DAOM 197198]|eukprot:XP_025172097.1 hypothetical protein GLOIN_2v1668662 [Rhizophagus irregularis DAOM 181602=DAOM 197198]